MRAKIVLPLQVVPNLIAALQEHMRVFSESTGAIWEQGACPLMARVAGASDVRTSISIRSSSRSSARAHPELVGRPVVIGGRPGGSGMVAAASREARRAGSAPACRWRRPPCAALTACSSTARSTPILRASLAGRRDPATRELRHRMAVDRRGVRRLAARDHGARAVEAVERASRTRFASARPRRRVRSCAAPR